MSDDRLAVDGGTPVRPQMLDYRRGAALLGEEEQQAVHEVIASKSLFRYYGPALIGTVASFETAVTQLLGVGHALGTSSGTAALRAGLAALGVGPGDEVIVPAVSFIATANAVVLSGAVPVFCDLDDSLGLDPAHLETLVSPRTAAIMPVHLENVVCDMRGVLEVAGRHGIPVIEDACQSMGATYFGTAAGALGDLGAYSLQLEKNITAGEGGVLVTSDDALALRAARYTDQGGQFVTGRGGSRGNDLDEPFVGENLRMTEISGALAGVQLGRLPGILTDMRAAKRKLVSLLGSRDGLTPRWVPDPEGDGGSSVIWYGPDAETASRFVTALLAEGIPSARLYDGKPLYSNASYQERRTAAGVTRSPWSTHEVDLRYPAGLCPRAEDLASRSICVAVGATYTASDVEDVATAVTKVADALL